MGVFSRNSVFINLGDAFKKENGKPLQEMLDKVG
jgi:hypothetical protein